MTLLEQLQNDQFDVSQGTEVERAYRRGWNACVHHVLQLLKLDAGLAELAHAPVIETIQQPLVELRDSMTYDDRYDDRDPDWEHDVEAGGEG